MFPMLIGISLISFFIMHLAPGDVTSNESSFNPKASEESRQKLRELYNLDKPVMVQYGFVVKAYSKVRFWKVFFLPSTTGALGRKKTRTEILQRA